MVLQDFGASLIQGFRKLAETKQIDEAFFRSFMADITKTLINADVSSKIAFGFAKKVSARVNIKEIPPGKSPRHVIEGAVIDELISLLNPERRPYSPLKKQANIIMMVGLQGSGKTTTCAKLGNYYKKRSWKTAVVAADTFRAGAREQLLQNCQRANIACYVDFDEQDPVAVAVAGVNKFKDEKFEIIIIDTSGRHMQEDALFEEMTKMADTILPDDIILVLDGTIGQQAYNQAVGFSKAVDVGSIIVTKLDSNAKGGGALSAIAATNSPIAFFGTGEDFTDLEFFDAKSFVYRLLGMGDGGAFARRMEEIDPQVNKEVSEHIIAGNFTFHDLYAQYQELLKMGNIDSLMDSVAAVPGRPTRGNSAEQTKETVKRILTVIDSMSDEEMSNPDLFKDEKRKIRICEGSGSPPNVVQYVLDEQKKWSKMFKKMDPTTLRIMAKDEIPTFANERQFKDQVMKVAKSMDPETLRTMGGIQGLATTLRASWKAAAEKKAQQAAQLSGK